MSGKNSKSKKKCKGKSKNSIESSCQSHESFKEIEKEPDEKEQYEKEQDKRVEQQIVKDQTKPQVKENKIQKVDLMICIPGSNFSKNWVKAWTHLVMNLLTTQCKFVVIQQYNANIYYSRMSCLLGNNQKGTFQKLFGGGFDYDHILWLDSDNIPSFQTYKRLLLQDKAIVAAIYHMQDKINFATVQNMDPKYYIKNNSNYQFINNNKLQVFRDEIAQTRIDTKNLPAKELKELEERKQQGIVDSYNIPIKNYLLKVAFTGMGCMLVKKGVFESIGYPWFMPEKFVVPGSNGTIDVVGDDVAFCLAAEKNGYDTFVDLGVQVGHEKLYIV